MHKRWIIGHTMPWTGGATAPRLLTFAYRYNGRATLDYLPATACDCLRYVDAPNRAAAISQWRATPCDCAAHIRSAQRTWRAYHARKGGTC